MVDEKVDPKTYPIRMEGSYADDSLFLIAATVEEGMNSLTRTEIEFVSNNRALELRKLVGSKVQITMDAPGGKKRVFPGTCVSVEYLGAPTGPGHYRAELRPWLWFLTRKRDSRVFQQMSVPTIIQTILGEFGFSGDVENRLNEDYVEREYVVQYRETALDFLNRLMEEEGIFYFFIESGGKEKLVLADGVSGYKPIAGDPKVPFRAITVGDRRKIEHIFDLRSSEKVTSGKVTLNDYDFEHPQADLFSSTAIPKGGHEGKDHEIYDYPGRFREAGDGKRHARVRMEAEAVRHMTMEASGNITTLGTGLTFDLIDHPRKSENKGYVITRVEHVFQLTGADKPPLGVTVPLGMSTATGGGADFYHVRVHAIPKAEQYRAPLRTPWPQIVGVHTAVVVGPAGEEIFPDKYGRVKVQFHWDRKGKNDEKSSLWIRTMMPWTGKNWGMIGLPRIGQEVVVQFEEGDPDRPVVIGMLYNSDTMPPYTLPGDMTKSGVVTRSTKDGSAGTFHELMFDDKKGAELVRFQSERDYRQIVKNNAEITVGLEHKDQGDHKFTVHRHLTETVKTGNHTFAVQSGSQTIHIQKDKTETIKGKSTLTVTGDVSETIEEGNRTEEIKMGNVTRTIKMGNETTTVEMGNYTVEAKLGKIGMKAMQEIKLEVGGSSITVDQMGVTIKGMMVKIEGTVMLEAKSVMTTVKGDGMLTLKGGLTMIN